MNQHRWSATITLLCWSLSIWLIPAKAGATFSQTPDHRFKRVFTVVLENVDYDHALAQPFMQQLATNGALLTNFTAITHPSQPNYIALVSGSTQGVTSDGHVNLTANHIGDLLEAKGLTWKVYAEKYPDRFCFNGDRGRYRRKHNPFISFMNIQSSPQRCARIINSSRLPQDITDGTLPNYSFYVPDLDDDGHDTDVTFADHWLQTAFSALLQDKRFIQETLFVVTFDEDDGDHQNHIYTVLYGPSVRVGSQSNKPYDHYSLLRTIEDNFSLGTLGKFDQAASPIDDVWN